MQSVYHILNGDALREQFPKNIKGEIIVCREALVDGDISGKTLETFFENRANFFIEFYGEIRDSYYKHSVKEFEKIFSIPENAVINL